MPQRNTRPGAADHARVVMCLAALGDARARVHVLRSARGAATVVARADLLLALEEYAAAIVAIGAPVPRRVTAEILLYRRLAARP